ncbi:chromatin-remodeling complex subunit ies6 [Ceratobasidium sp. 394]|nr:chromatin-remodeling complex subunit ies6 [Ceratobasidium sp. 394]
MTALSAKGRGPTRRPPPIIMPPKGVKRKSTAPTPVQPSTPQPPSLVESLSYAHYPRPFKNPAYIKNTNRRAKSAKQVLGAEREREKLVREKVKPHGTDVDWTEDPDAMTFTSIEAPPSVLPQKRYCEITGLEGPYTDPASGLRYHDKSIYELIKSLNPASMQAYRSVRNPHSVVK